MATRVDEAQIVGQGNFTYERDTSWGRREGGVPQFGVAQALFGDSKDRVYVFVRSPAPEMLVFNRKGKLLDSWGFGRFKHPHGIWMNDEDELYLTDRDTHLVTKWTADGTFVKAWGTANQPGEPGAPFNQPTKAVETDDGELYVSDGYGQHRMHRFAKNGQLIRSWGEKGTGPGQFGWPVHSVLWHPAGKVLIVDRENHRIQHFTPEGDYLMEWTDFHVPQDIYRTPDDILFVAEGHPRITIMKLDGEIITRWGERGSEPGQFPASPHACWVDSQGSLYVGEVTTYDCFQKFVRV